MKSLSKKVKVYARLQLQLATPGKVICMLHTRCSQLIKQTITGESPDTRKSLDHAQNIIVQLERSLKDEDQLSRSIYLLYDYCYCQLEAGLPVDSRKALTIITKLGETFDMLYAAGKN